MTGPLMNACKHLMNTTITRAIALAALPAALLLAGCERRYPSRMEARWACVDWARSRNLNMGMDPCREEDQTRQILGLDNGASSRKVAARFRW